MNDKTTCINLYQNIACSAQFQYTYIYTFGSESFVTLKMQKLVWWALPQQVGASEVHRATFYVTHTNNLSTAQKIHNVKPEADASLIHYQ